MELKSILAIATLSLASFSFQSIAAKNDIVYRWVDDNNVVHFSHNPPADKDYAEIRVRVSYASTDPITTDEDAIEDNEQDNATNIAHLSDEEKQKHCESAQTNKKILTSFERVLMSDEDGNEKAMTEDEKAKQLELSEKYIDIYCEADTDS